MATRIPGLDRAVRPALGKMTAAVEAILVRFSKAFTREELAGGWKTMQRSAAWPRLAGDLRKLFGPVGTVLANTLRRAAKLTASAPPGLEIDWVAFDAAAKAYLERAGAVLVTLVTEETRRAIRDVLLRTEGPGSNQRDIVRGLLDVRGLGLSTTQTRQLIRYARDELRPKLDAGEITKRQYADLIRRRTGRLHRERAVLIGHFEAWAAGNEGRLITYQQAVASGALDAQRYELEWITRTIGVCPLCLALAGKRRPIVGGIFVSDSVPGKGKNAGVTSIARPPRHPRCFCGIRTVLRR